MAKPYVVQEPKGTPYAKSAAHAAPAPRGGNSGGGGGVSTPTTGNGSSDLIVVSVLVISGTAILKDTGPGGGGFKMHTVVSGFLLGSALLLVAAVSPSIAKALALMGIVGALTTNGPAAFKVIGKI